MVDADEEGYLLQIFFKTSWTTLFFEIIQRMGNPKVLVQELKLWSIERNLIKPYFLCEKITNEQHVLVNVVLNFIFR
jgi:hypothetical protein